MYEAFSTVGRLTEFCYRGKSIGNQQKLHLMRFVYQYTSNLGLLFNIIYESKRTIRIYIILASSVHVDNLLLDSHLYDK